MGNDFGISNIDIQLPFDESALRNTKIECRIMNLGAASVYVIEVPPGKY